MPLFDNLVLAGRRSEADAPTVAMSGSSVVGTQEQLSRSRGDGTSDEVVDESNKEDGQIRLRSFFAAGAEQLMYEIYF